MAKTMKATVVRAFVASAKAGQHHCWSPNTW